MKRMIQTDKDLIDEWRNHWKNSSIENGLKQIAYEDNFRHNFQKLFKKGDKVLEAGCGLGRYCFWLEEQGINAVGIDIVREAIIQGKKYAKAKEYKAKLLTGDVRKLPFANDSFDGYISLGIIEHFKEKRGVQATFSEAYRVLKPGGYAYFLVPNPIAIHMLAEKFLSMVKLIPCLHHRALFKKDLIRHSVSCGFNIINTNYHDFYFPFYSIVRSLMRRDIFPLKTLMKRGLNFFDRIPILKNFGSGIAIILQKPNSVLG